MNSAATICLTVYVIGVLIAPFVCYSMRRDTDIMELRTVSVIAGVFWPMLLVTFMAMALWNCWISVVVRVTDWFIEWVLSEEPTDFERKD